jgi:CheY-like chemotaxis protein
MKALTPNARKQRIMVVDDVPSMRSLLVAILKGFGISKICVADNGASALKTLENRPVDLIFCDWEMPVMNGLQLFEELRQNPANKDIKFVMITSVAELDKVKTAINTGVENYIVKPFKESTIIDRLNQLFPAETEQSADKHELS